MVRLMNLILPIYLLGKIPKCKYTVKMHHVLKEDLVKLKQIKAQVKLIDKYKIGTVEQLTYFINCII